MAHQCQAGKLAIQSEYVPMILTAVSCYLTENNPDEAIEWLDDMKVTND
jgi:pentatricopeptide repeat protein